MSAYPWRHNVCETQDTVQASHSQEEMLMTTLILLVTNVLLGGLFIAVAVPLIQGRVKPNPWYGVRVRKTLDDPDTWYAVNAYFGRRFAVMGLFIAVAGIALSPLGLIPQEIGRAHV